MYQADVRQNREINQPRGNTQQLTQAQLVNQQQQQNANHLWSNVQQTQQLTQPKILEVQKNQQVLDQIQGQYRYQRPEIQAPQQMINQRHQVVHPQSREVIHKEQPVMCVTRDDIEGPWKKKCEQLSLALTEVQTEVMRLRGIGATEKVTYVEDTIKLNQLYLEIERLNKIILDQSIEIENYKHKYNMASDKNARMITGIDIDNMRALMLENENMLKAENNKLRYSLEEWQKRYRILELSLSEARGGEPAFKQLEENISQYRQEIDRVNGQLMQARLESEELRSKLQKAEAQLRESATQEVEIRRLKEMVDTRNRDIENLKYSNDTEPLKKEIRQKTDEIERLRNQVTSLEYRVTDNQRYSYNTNPNNNNIIQDLKLQIEQLHAENEDWNQKFNDLLQRNDELESQQDPNGLQQIRREAESWQLKYREQNAEYYRLQTKNMQLEAEVEAMRRAKIDPRSISSRNSSMMN